MSTRRTGTPLAILAASVATLAFLLTPAGQPTLQSVTEYLGNPTATNPAAPQ